MSFNLVDLDKYVIETPESIECCKVSTILRNFSSGIKLEVCVRLYLCVLVCSLGNDIKSIFYYRLYSKVSPCQLSLENTRIE